MNSYIVTEGRSDVVLLRELLRPILDRTPDVHITEGGGWSGADSLARSLLVTRRRPVALVVDANSTDPARIRERAQFLEQSLGQVAPRSLWRVFLAEPELEAILFADKPTLEKLVGRDVLPDQFLRGAYQPKETLRLLLGSKTPEQVFSHRLPRMDLSKLREIAWVRELTNFVNSAAKHSVNGNKRAAAALAELN